VKVLKIQKNEIRIVLNSVTALGI